MLNNAMALKTLYGTPERYLEGSSYFTINEFRCSCCASVELDLAFLVRLHAFRKKLNRHVNFSSAYRCPRHPDEINKKKPGMHAKARAVDIKVTDVWHRACVIEAAILCGFKGIGIAKDFVHIDDREVLAIWTY